jgi:hypothetical protein
MCCKWANAYTCDHEVYFYIEQFEFYLKITELSYPPKSPIELEALEEECAEISLPKKIYRKEECEDCDTKILRRMDSAIRNRGI